MKASLKNYRQAPRKVRMIADLIRGKKVADALNTLKFVDKRAAGPFAKVITSAAANAINAGKNGEAMKITKVTVDEAPTYKRFRARARGAASTIRKRGSHLTVELG